MFSLAGDTPAESRYMHTYKAPQSAALSQSTTKQWAPSPKVCTSRTDARTHAEAIDTSCSNHPSLHLQTRMHSLFPNTTQCSRKQKAPPPPQPLQWEIEGTILLLIFSPSLLRSWSLGRYLSTWGWLHSPIHPTTHSRLTPFTDSCFYVDAR